MTDLPSMPMFWAEFFADTKHVSGEAAGAYVLLLGHAWLRGAKLPDNDLALSRMAGVGPRKWAALKTEVMSFWTLSDGHWTQKRLSKEWNFVCRQREIKRSLGKLGGERSAAKRREISKEAVKRTVKHPTPTPTPTLFSDDKSSLVIDGEKTNEKKKINGAELQALGEGWNAIAAALKLPEIEQIKPGSMRERLALARLREMHENFPDIPTGIGALQAKIRQSPYLRGEVNGFRCNFNWVMNATNYEKIMEGTYEDRKITKFR